MKKIMHGVLLASAALFSTAADAKGCIKGAIVGGIAGHYAGHGKIGAVAGCIIGRHEANKADADRGTRGRPHDPPAADDGRL